MDSCLGKMIFNGALTVIIIAVIVIFASTGSKSKKIDPLEVPPGASVKQSQDETTTRSGVLSGNSMNFVPQLNLGSTVNNCFGEYSCLTLVNTTTFDSRTFTTIDVRGDKNSVGSVLRSCINGEGYGYTTYEMCREGYREESMP